MTDSDGYQIDTTMKYLPFGGTRSGNVPTDKKFTGQRLDNTGLYYYGARYYDPLIGRFISPDTIIPNPANPQSFNRYSYCLNNPLRYVDPSGNVVEIAGVDITDIDAAMASGDYWKCVELAETIHTAGVGDIVIAYGTLREVAPELTGYLETNPATVNIKFGDIGAWGETSPNGFEITLNSNLLGIDSRAMVSVLGHEGFHSAIILAGIHGIDYIASEAYANSFGWWVGWKLGYDAGELNPISSACNSVNPYHPGLFEYNLKSIKESLVTAYWWLEKCPPWPKLINPEYTGGLSFKDYFLNAAESLWCVPDFGIDWP
jgi:RHS repeat-associated protein